MKQVIQLPIPFEDIAPGEQPVQAVGASTDHAELRMLQSLGAAAAKAKAVLPLLALAAKALLVTAFCIFMIFFAAILQG